jgi:glucose-1-phosphate adenylyltransferase
MYKVLAMILAGGMGTRLEPLTLHRAKPAVPFGGKYRIIDIVLSNFVNSGIFNIAVLTQFKAESLIDHIENGWQLQMGTLAGGITVNPAQQRVRKDWYLGTADAVYQNFNRLEKINPEIVCIFGGDHIYKMNIKEMIEYHLDRGSDMTISAISVPVAKAANTYGVIEVDEQYNVVGFEEKPAEPKPLPDDPTRCLVSMGNYVFNRDLLVFAFTEDAAKEYVSKSRLQELTQEDPTAHERYSTHDIGYDLIPFLHRSGLKILVYDFANNRVPGVSGNEIAYWRDVGGISEYYDANMDVCGTQPTFNLYNDLWPLRSSQPAAAPAKFALTSELFNSVISEGCIISQARVINSVMGYNVRLEVNSSVAFSVLFNGVSIGRDAKLRRTIVDKYVSIPPGISIGYNPEEDQARGFLVSPGGITVVPKRYNFGG